MSFLGRLFGTDKATESIINHTARGLDALYYSDEEKAQDAGKARQASLDVLMEWFKSTTGSRLARRIIALIVTSIWAMQYVTAQILSVAAIWSTDNADKLNLSAQTITQNAQSSNGAMMLVLAFYFAAPHIGDVVKPAIERFTKSP